MHSATANRTTAEVMYGNFTNAEGATITTGFPVCWTTTAASVNANLAVLPATDNFITFVGVSRSDVPDNGTSIFIGYGYAASTRIFACGTSVTNAVGIAMGTNAASLGVNSTGLLDSYGPAVSLEAIGAAVNSPGGWAKAMIRAM